MVTPDVEKHVVFDWDAFHNDLCSLPDSVDSDSEHKRIKDGMDLLERIQNQDFPFDALVALTDNTIATAWELIRDPDDSESSSPFVEQAHFMVDTEAWDELVGKIYRLEAQCDSSMGEVFI
ncbi:hypothetical protein [Alicyclobacillus fodiniaquatilis]|uniref:Uncharacterized protein n=1 Tax=Alicyclobacillus fodiniaquatilis TaxID=1661150 RepID=A0ABW4JIA3_9BACL